MISIPERSETIERFETFLNDIVIRCCVWLALVSFLILWFKLVKTQRIPKVRDAVKKIILRTLKLLFWGVLLQGNKTSLAHFFKVFSAQD